MDNLWQGRRFRALLKKWWWKWQRGMGWQVRTHFWRVRNHISTLSFKRYKIYRWTPTFNTGVTYLWIWNSEISAKNLGQISSPLEDFFTSHVPVILDSGYDCCWYINGRSCHAASDHEASNGGGSSSSCFCRGSSSGTSPGSKARRWENGQNCGCTPREI